MLYPRASLIQKFPGQAGNKSPYTLEIEKSYGAAVSLDTPVGFASSSRIREGVLDEFKVLVVPGARYVEADVFDRIKEWVAKGGTLVITPTSLIADEYTRKRDYLKQIGIEITAEELPEFMAGEAKRGIDQSGELDFIQGPVAKTAIVKEPKRTVVVEKAGLFAAGPATLEAAGIIQNVKPSADWKVLAKYRGEETPAILVRKMGKGEVYYLAGSLDVPSRQIVFDRLMDALAFPRAIRAFAPDGKYPEGVESRTVAFDGALLTYLHNFTGKGVTVKLSAAKDIGDIFNVNTETKVDSPTMTLAPYETRIMKVKMK
jgi:beta-galactosidase GanA